MSSTHIEGYAGCVAKPWRLSLFQVELQTLFAAGRTLPADEPKKIATGFSQL